MKKSLLLLALSAGMCILLSSTDFEAMPPPAGADLSPFIMTGSFCAPLSDTVVTDQFGWRFHPQELCLDFHSGIDLSAESGTLIRAFMSGTADIVGIHESYGKYIRIDHGNGFFTLYAHCSKLLIRKGETVRIGQCIAKVGQTGQATGPHLHFEMIMNSTKLDPLWALGDIPAIQETL